MTAISPVSSNGSVTSLFATSNGDVMAKAIAVLMTRYESLKGDLATQIADLETRNATKRLWNEQLLKLNRLTEEVAAAGKESNQKVEVYVSAADLPYKDYKVSTTPGGEPRLVPTTTDAANQLCVGDDCVPIYGLAGSDPKTAAATQNSLTLQKIALAQRRVSVAEPSPEFAKLVVAAASMTHAPGTTIVGYKIKISADQLKAATDSVRTQIDSLNTENEIGMLRLNDTFGKSNLALEQMGKLLNGQNETATKLLANF
jgi:hypothetical protein